jgi:hypothetical protein
MSADNWTTCPRCVKHFEQAEAERVAKLRESYGKIPPEEFVQAMQVESPEPEDTLREDYHQGINAGLYSVSYHCSCNACGFSWSYKYQVGV